MTGTVSMLEFNISLFWRACVCVPHHLPVTEFVWFLFYLFRTAYKINICWPDLTPLGGGAHFLLMCLALTISDLGVKVPLPSRVTFLGIYNTSVFICAKTFETLWWYVTGRRGKLCHVAATRCSLTRWHADRVTHSAIKAHIYSHRHINH